MAYSISPSPKWDAPDPALMLQHAMDMPFSPLKDFASMGASGVMTSMGLGTMLRGATTPAGNEMPMSNPLSPIDTILNAPAEIRAGVENVGRLVTGQPNPPLSEDAYKASPYYRKEIPWDAGMTEDRAASLASQLDVSQARAIMDDKGAFTGPFGWRINPAGLAGGFAGQMLDPVNFVPIFGESAKAAAAARHGLTGLLKVGAETGINAAEAAANTAIFGAATASLRAKYGDDVSWQAQIGNIAMAAAIGGVVTPVIHGLGRVIGLAGDRAEAKVQSQVETVPNVGVSRAVLNDAVTGLATDGEVRLSPASGAAIDRLSADVTAKRDAAVALARETRSLADLAPNDVRAGKVVVTPSGARVEVQPEVVDLSTLQKATGNLQVRDRTRVASQAQVEDIGRNLDPARLMPSIEADRGAPIVGPDNVIDSGNGRVAGIQRAYEAYPDQAAAYRKAIEDRGYSTEGMAQPVLISRRVTPLGPDARAQFNAEANQSATARMSATELAAMDRNALDDPTMRELADGPVTSADNRAFVQRFLANLPANERAGLVDAAGGLNKDGTRRIENALVAAAYGDVDAGVIARFAEATDDNTRSVVGALSDVAGQWALMRRAIKAGEISPEFDVTPELTSGLRKLSAWRDAAAREGRPVSTVIKEGMGQLDMLDGEMSLEAKTMIRAFYKTDEFKQGAGRDAIASRLNKIVDAANDLGRPQLFGDAAAATKLGVLTHAIDDSETDLFAAADAGTGTDGIRQSRGQRSAGADRGNAAQGAGLGESGGPERSGADAAGVERSVDEGAAGAPSPKVVEVFHGTLDKFDTLDPAKLGSETGSEDAKLGFYFVDNAKVAEGYAAPVNPYDHKIFSGKFGRAYVALNEAIVKLIRGRGLIGEPGRIMRARLTFDNPLVHDAGGKEMSGAARAEVIRKAKADGHDGVVFENSRDPGYTDASDIPANVYVAFDPKKVEIVSWHKSAADAEAAVAKRSSEVAPRAETQAVLPFPERLPQAITDMTQPRPDLPPDGLHEAAGRVGTPERLQGLAEQFGVDFATGEYPEQFAIEQLRKSGALSAEDEKVLGAADDTYAAAEAFGNTLKAALECIV